MYAEHRTCRPNVCRTSKGKTAGANHLAIQKQQADHELFQTDEGHQSLQTGDTGRLLSHAIRLLQVKQLVLRPQRLRKQQQHRQHHTQR